MKITHESYNIRNKILERSLEELKELTPEQVQTIVNLLKEIQDDRKRQESRRSNGIDYATRPLLTIELENESSVPKVLYKGEEIDAKTHISFDWRTQKQHSGTGGLDMMIEHYDDDIKSIRIIGRKRGGFM